MRNTSYMRSFGIVTLLVTAGAAAGDFSLDWWTIDGGGDMWTVGGAFELSGTPGQPDASPVFMWGGGFELAGGVWPGARDVGPLPPGDCDGDYHVDIDDFVVFGDCMEGPNVEIISTCACTDLDRDGDADMADFALFQRVFTGP